jgi:CheY-like chemotaxis protein
VRILIVDDSPGFRNAMKLTLERGGHTVCWAQTGERGLEMLESEQPDVMLLDLNLGAGIDGFEVARRKQRTPRIAAIPVIVTTGLGDDAVSSHDTSNPLAGAYLTLSKPVNLKRLDRALRIIEAHRPSSIPPLEDSSDPLEDSPDPPEDYPDPPLEDPEK